MDPKSFLVPSVCLVLITLTSYSLAQNSFPNLPVPKPIPLQPGLGDGQGCDSLVQSDILKQLLVAYDTEVRPPPGNSPTLVTGNANVLNIPSVDEANYRWTVNLYFRQWWNDTRLQYQKLVQGCPNFRYISLTTEEGVASIWKPNLFYPQQVAGEIVELLQANRGVRIFPDGSVLYSVHMSVSLFCSGEGSKPGEFLCPFLIKPYGLTLDEMRMEWKQPTPIELANSDLDMENHVLGSIDTSVIEMQFSSGSYAALLANFHFLRKACLA